MKIAIIRKKYTFHGGAESFSSSLVRCLAEKGHEVHIFAIKWGSKSNDRNIHFHKLPAITFISFLRDLTFAVSALILLRRRRNDFDIIQAHDKTLYQDIYRAGDGCHVEWLRQRWNRIGLAGKLSIVFNPYHWLILYLERSILKGGRFSRVIAISQMVRENIMSNYKVPAEKIEVIYNGVDLKRFNPANRDKYRARVRQKYGIADDAMVLLFVGSGFERKGVKFLFEAVKSVKEPLTVMVVGKGDSSVFNHNSNDQRMIFCGPQEDIDHYYAAADVFVFPTMYEPFGNVHLEALASGLPVVTSKNSGAAEIITEGENGFVIERPEDIASLAEKIRFFILNRERLKLMSDNARRLAEGFSFEKHISRMQDLYERIIAEKEIMHR